MSSQLRLIPDAELDSPAQANLPSTPVVAASDRAAESAVVPPSKASQTRRAGRAGRSGSSGRNGRLDRRTVDLGRLGVAAARAQLHEATARAEERSRARAEERLARLGELLAPAARTNGRPASSVATSSPDHPGGTSDPNGPGRAHRAA
ncbi:MAG: hypothetical protein FJW94_03180 [Actinobacteria bacterium]|nr:hypothetical protein [Actinomycetota bacterium]